MTNGFTLPTLRARSWPPPARAGVAIVGILNVTPDSFFDGGRYADPERAVAHAEAMVAAGADALDVGGESTRPGATPVPEAEEMRRVLPVLRRIRPRVSVPISIDTYKVRVARAALDAGADIVNDVSAGRFAPDMLEVVAATGAAVVLMHMRGAPADMQLAPTYPGDDVVGAVRDFLRERALAAEAAGVEPGRIVLDPGIGFGKTTPQNLRLIDRLDALVALGYPVMVGLSRKRFIGELTGQGPADRLAGTAAAVTLAIDRGVSLVRVHDVDTMVPVARVAAACRGGSGAAERLDGPVAR
jgi:dihydropteroate synthase